MTDGKLEHPTRGPNSYAEALEQACTLPAQAAAVPAMDELYSLVEENELLKRCINHLAGGTAQGLLAYRKFRDKVAAAVPARQDAVPDEENEDAMTDPYVNALEEIEKSILPYRVELDTQGCKTCGHDAQWCVVNPDGVAMGKTWGDRDEAQWFAEMLKMAHDAGASPQPTQTAVGEGELPPLDEGTWDHRSRAYNTALEQRERQLRELGKAHKLAIAQRDEAREKVNSAERVGCVFPQGNLCINQGALDIRDEYRAKLAAATEFKTS